MDDTRHLDIEESASPAALDWILAYGPLLPPALALVAAFVLEPAEALLAARLGAGWGGIILVFLAGVRRGVSFRTPGGPKLAQIATMLLLFGLGVAATASSAAGGLPAALGPGLGALGFLAVALLDPAAARRGEAPRSFARLRPLQMGLGAALQIGLLAAMLR